jgi:hypothetical protein
MTRLKWRYWAGAALVVALFCVVAIRQRTAVLAAPAQLPATRAADDTPFIRFVEDGKGGGKLETAIVTYKNANGVTLHLIGALHVGEKSYYQGLSRDFAKYDALLYEMIKPKGAPPPAPGFKSQSGISMFQRFLKDMLKLDFQLDDIDYTRKNFVHADLDAETFFSMQKERGESILGIMLKSMLREMQKQAAGQGNPHEITGLDLFIALRAPDRAQQLKLLLARQFEDIEDQMAGLDGPNGSVIITERNKKCIQTLKKAIADGDKNIGIFYGAGHMHDLEQRVEKMGFHKTDAQWRVGWDMTALPAPATKPATQPAPGK